MNKYWLLNGSALCFKQTLFLHLVGFFTDSVTQIVHAGIHLDGLAVHFHFVNHWRVNGKYTLNAHT